MHRDNSARPRYLNNVKLGLGANIRKSERICSERAEAGSAFSNIEVLNLSVSSSDIIPINMNGMISMAGLESVIHLEEVNISTDLDEYNLDEIMQRVSKLSPLWIEQDLGLWVAGGAKLGAHMLNPILTEEGLSNTIDNIRRITALAKIPFLAENPPIYISIEEIDLLSFMSRLAESTECGLVFDVGHYIGYCMSVGKDPYQYFHAWRGREHIMEVHIAGYEVYETPRRSIWLDKHSIVIPSYGLNLMREVVNSSPNVQIVTLEQDGAEAEVERKNIESVHSMLTR